MRTPLRGWIGRLYGSMQRSRKRPPPSPALLVTTEVLEAAGGSPDSRERVAALDIALMMAEGALGRAYLDSDSAQDRLMGDIGERVVLAGTDAFPVFWGALSGEKFGIPADWSETGKEFMGFLLSATPTSPDLGAETANDSGNTAPGVAESPVVTGLACEHGAAERMTDLQEQFEAARNAVRTWRASETDCGDPPAGLARGALLAGLLGSAYPRCSIGRSIQLRLAGSAASALEERGRDGCNAAEWLLDAAAVIAGALADNARHGRWPATEGT